MMNSQCAGLTTRFAISRVFPDADIYSSWDSTFFTEDKKGKVTSSEGSNCFVAILQGMAKNESHAQLENRIRKAQDPNHPQIHVVRDFVQFVGPSYPLVVERFTDVNEEAKSDLYDGFLDFHLKEIAERLQGSATPRNPGVSPSEIAGEAANGLDWAAGSLDRVAHYSEFWMQLPKGSALSYSFEAAGFYDQHQPPEDVAAGALKQDLGRLPSVCRYSKDARGQLKAEIMFHAWLSHAAKEYKRLLVAAEAIWRALDQGYLPSSGPLATPLGKRGLVLLTMAGLLAFPADANGLNGLWAQALDALNLPDLSLSMVSGCITEADHNANNYYGGARSLSQLIATLPKADPVAFAKLQSQDPAVGRARELDLPR